MSGKGVALRDIEKGELITVDAQYDDVPVLKKIDAVLVKVPSIEKGLDFYREQLGMRTAWKTEDIAAVRLGDGNLVLEGREVEPGPRQEGFKQVAPLLRRIARTPGPALDPSLRPGDPLILRPHAGGIGCVGLLPVPRFQRKNVKDHRGVAPRVEADGHNVPDSELPDPVAHAALGS